MAPAKARSAPTAPGFAFVRELDGIHEFRLKANGLRVLLAKDDSVPVAGFMVTYHVGSRHEATGFTGATHMLEHLMFKRSERFNPEGGTTIDQLIESKGGVMNATTWLDRTNYFQILAKEELPLAIEMEADRMRTAVFLDEERASEMPVVRNEFERGENDPREMLDKEVWAAAFTAHPYHHATIGWRSDIENVPIERLRAFYDEYYWPDNATATVAGDFDERKTLAAIAREFGRHTAKPGGYPGVYTEEPEQRGQRRVRVERAGVDTVCLAHKIPEAAHADLPALLVLATVLDDGKTSRLYRALVDPALATDAQVYCNRFREPSLFQTYVTLAPGVPHAKAEGIVAAEYARLKDELVPAAELKRAKRSLRASFAARRDGPYAFLMAVNEDLAAGDWTLFSTFPESVERVTAKDVRRVAQAYLDDRTSVAGWFVNTAG